MNIQDNINGQINFIYFCTTKNNHFIDSIWKEQPHVADHFKSKFTTNAFRFFFELSYDNQEKFINYVDSTFPTYHKINNDTFNNDNLTIKNPVHGQVNILYFMTNFKHGFIDECWNDNKLKAEQFKNTLGDLKGNLYQMFFDMMDDDKIKLLHYVDKNYCAFSHFKKNDDLDLEKSDEKLVHKKHKL